MATSPATAPWWTDGVGYEVYLRSFADGDGDGLGDLPGLLGRLDHLAWLGVRWLWITPFYPSPMADHGYDVTDHCGVDPRYGTLADIDAVVAEAHRLGLRVVLDVIPNHTSDRHPWFRTARCDVTNPYRNYYLWRPAGPDGGPPNNWVSYFGGPAWTYCTETEAYYLHLFLPEQPDLNWANPAVNDEFDRILEFWLDRDVDGLRIDVAQGLHKHPDLPDNPRTVDAADLVAPGEHPGPRAEFAAFEHRFDIGQPATLEVFRRWRAIADRTGAVLLGEVYLDPVDVQPYVSEQDGVHLSFTFALMASPWDHGALGDALRTSASHLGHAACWVQASHDEPRPATRFGGDEIGRDRARALALLLAGLPGPMVLYQGEELGLTDGVVSPQQAADPMATRNREADDSRDGCRTPMPWAPGPGLGFTTSSQPWLPLGEREPSDTVASQRTDPASTLVWYRHLCAAARSFAHPEDPLEWMECPAPLLAYRRGDTMVASLAVGAPSTAFDPGPGHWVLACSSSPDRPTGRWTPGATLLADEAVVLVRPAPGDGTTTGEHGAVDGG